MTKKNTKMAYRYSILTYIFNNYERLKEIKDPQEDVEYICITDDANLKSDTWKVVYDKNLEGLSTFDKCYKVRFSLFDYVSTDICIRIDSSIEICKSLDNLINKFNNSGYKLALMPHPRHNLVDEYNAWISTRGYSKERAISILNILGNITKYDFTYKGQAELTICIERKCKEVEDLDRMTYALLKYLGEENKIERVDQTIYSVILNRYFNKLPVMLIFNQLLLDSPYCKIYHHDSDETYSTKYDRTKKYSVYFFNEIKELEFVD